VLRRSLLVLAAVLAVSAHAAPAKKVALLSATVFKGSSANGPVITDALEDNLRGAGLRVSVVDSVEKALKGRKYDPKTPLTAGDLVALKKSLGVDYVVYPRVLGVGVGVNSDRASATVLVNVGGSSTSNFVHTRQIGQPFGESGIDSDAGTKAVIDEGAAGKLAQELLAGFYNRVGIAK
jgi:hypothetical protein